MIYGYIYSAKTKDGSKNKQEKAIKEKYPTAVIFEDVLITEKKNRPELKRLLGKAESGDVIVMQSITLISENAEETTAILSEMLQRGIQFSFLKEPYLDSELWTITSTEELLNTQIDILFGGMNYVPKKITRRKEVDARDIILKNSKDFEGTLDDMSVMRMTGIKSRNTYYKYKRALKEERKEKDRIARDFYEASINK